MSLFTNLLANVELTGSIRSLFNKQFPGGNNRAARRGNAPFTPVGTRDNGAEELYSNAAGTDWITGTGVGGPGSDDNFYLGEEVYPSMRKTIQFNLSTAASLVNQQFFIVPAACRLVGATEIHATAESTATTCVVQIERLSSGQIVAAGTNLLNSSGFNAKGTAETLQTATLSMPTTGDSSDQNLHFAGGERLAVKFSTAPTELAGVVITLTFAPAGDQIWVKYNMNANGDLVDQSFFVADRPCIVTAAYYVHGTLGTNGSAVNVQLTKDVSTNAPGAGTDLLTNNTNAGFNCKAAINVVQTGTLTATAASLRLAPSDRLSVDFAGTLTALAGVVLIVVIQPLQRYKYVQFTLEKNANLADQSFFTADRNYYVQSATAVWATASSGATNVQLTVESGTTAPGGGTDLLSNDTNTGWQTDGTANTPEVGIWKDTRFNYIMAGDRLSLDFSGTLTALAGLTVTVALIPA